MRAFIYIALAIFATVAAASSTANPFKVPSGGYTFTVGQATTLKWTPTTSGTVSLRLQHGQVTTSNSGTSIASGIDNSGSYTWTVPSDVTTESYTVEIISDSNPGDYNFLPQFTVAGATASASASASATSSAAATTSTSSEPSTTSTSTSSEATMATMTTMTTATSTTSTGSSSSETSTSSSTSTNASSSASASQTAVPTTNAGLVNRVSGGMLAIVAGAIAVM